MRSVVLCTSGPLAKSVAGRRGRVILPSDSEESKAEALAWFRSEPDATLAITPSVVDMQLDYGVVFDSRVEGPFRQFKDDLVRRFREQSAKTVRAHA